MRRSTIIAGLIALATLAVYGQVVGFDFVDFDDDRYLIRNPAVRAGLTAEGFGWAFRNGYAAAWQPVTWLSLMADQSLYGFVPGGFHATSALLHLLNSLLLFAIFRSLTGALWRSGAVAALFALHPLHVESVAWVSERKDVLSTCFGLLSMWAYVGWTRRRRRGLYLISLVALALGLMSKTTLVTFPCLYLLLDYWPLGRLQRGNGVGAASASARTAAALLIEKLPFFPLAGAAGFAALHFQGEAGTVMPTETLPARLSLANALCNYVVYAFKALWPTRLAVQYPHPYVPGTGGIPWSAWQVAGAALLLAVVSAAALWRTRRQPYLIVGWLWYLGTLLPVIGLLQVGAQGHADRYTYIPLIGLSVIVVWGATEIVERLSARRPRIRHLVAGAATLALAACAATAWLQVRHWRDSVSLFEHAIEVDPRNRMMHFNLANSLKALGQRDEAIEHYRAAIAIDPAAVSSRFNLANTLRERGDLEEAIHGYQRITVDFPAFEPAWLALAGLHESAGRHDESIAVLRSAVEFDDASAQLHYLLANALRQRGQVDEAILHYEAALAAQPDLVGAYQNLGNALLSQGRPEDAAERYRQALRIDPDNAQLHYNLAVVLGSQKRFEEAIEQYSEALRLNPKHAKAHFNLGLALEARGDRELAIPHYRRALELDPNHTRAKQRLLAAEGAAPQTGPRENLP